MDAILRCGGGVYTFANNEPSTHLNGNELLGLLEKYDYKFRINLKRAFKLALTEG